MAASEEINADMLAFWNGNGGRTWVARQEHTDITLTPVTDALLGFAAPRAGERVVDIGCGCGVPTLEFAGAVGRSIRDQLDGLLDEAGRQELSLRETLVLLCEREITSKDERRIEMTLKLARFPFVRELAGARWIANARMCCCSGRLALARPILQ